MIRRHALHRWLPRAFLLLTLSADRARAGLEPVDRMQFFLAPDRAATLQWTLDSSGAQDRLSFEITDFWGGNVAAAEADVIDGRRCEIPVKLARGYYEIAFPQLKQRFGLCVLPEPDGPADAFFCMDSALSWLEKREELRRVLPRMLKRMNVSVSRERVRWGGIHRAEQRWDWQTADRYETLRQAYERAGVGVLELAHDSPAWMGARRDNRYPSDLPAAARSWEQIERRWRPYWSALEVWNEPDIHFGSNLPADQYVQVVKAVAYGVRDARPVLPLVGGAFTGGCPEAYRRLCAQNGLLDHVDAVSFHTYGPPEQVETMAGTYRAWLKGFGKESMPLWITEAGRPWKKGPGRPTLQEDAVSALDIVMKGIEARACGIASYFAFVYVYYEETTNNFGMLGRDATPLRCLAGYTQVIAALANKPYRGDLTGLDPAVKRARVFGDANRSVIVLYTGQVDAAASVRLAVPFRRLEGIDGRSLVQSGDGTIPIPDGLTYVWVESAKLADGLRTDTPAMRLYTLSRHAPPTRPRPSPIILQHLFDPRQASASKYGFTVTPDQAAKFALCVRVNNLSDHARRIDLDLSRIGQADERNHRFIEVPAAGIADITWDLNLGDFVDARGACTLAVTGKTDGNDLISPLAVAVNISPSPSDTMPAAGKRDGH